MELIDILKIEKKDLFKSIGKVVQVDTDYYRSISSDAVMKSVLIKKCSETLYIKILLNENIDFKFFIKEFGFNFTSLYNHYDEETYFNYKYEDKIISFICDNYFVNNHSEASIKEITVVCQ